MLDELLLHLRRDLRLPIPTGLPETWTTLLATFGVSAAFDPRYTTALVLELLQAAGRPVQVDEQGLLLWVTPLERGPSAVERLLSVVDTQAGAAAISLLGHRGDRAAIQPLTKRLERAGRPHRGSTWVALARLGTTGAGLHEWTPDHAIEQLLARLLLAERGQGAELDEVPAYFPMPLQQWLDGEPMADELLTLAARDDRLREPIARLLLLRPDGVFARHVPTLAAFGLEDPVWWPALPTSDPAMLDALVDCLQHDEWRVRAGAAVLIAQLGTLPDGAAALLRRALDDDDLDVRREAALALHGSDPTVPLDVPTSRFHYPERADLRGLAGPPVSGEAWGLLTRATNDDAGQRVLLSLALEDPTRYAPLLEAFCLDRGRDQPLALRRAAAAGLLQARVVPSSLPVVQRLLLRPPDHAATPATGADPAALAAVIARDADWEVRLGALRLLARSGTSLADHAALLEVVATTDSDPAVREEARTLLPPTYGVPTLGDRIAACLVQRPDDATDRGQALLTLHEHDPGAAVSLAHGLVGSEHRDVALASARILAGAVTLSTCADQVRAPLADLRSENWVRREAAAVFLGCLPRTAVIQHLVDEIAELLDEVASHDPDEDVRSMAAWAYATLRRPA